MPDKFGIKLHGTSAFSTSPDPYWTNLANKTHQILAHKYAIGQLKPPATVRKAKVPKVAYLLIVLCVVAFPSAYLYGQYSGSFQAQTTLRAPIVVHMSQFSIPSLWSNKSGSFIQDGVFTINPNGVQTTYSFRVFATVTYWNGTQTQDMTQLFRQLTVSFNNGIQNMTVASLLSPNQTVSFIASNNVDEVYRLIFTYDMKAVDLGTTSSTSLVFSFLYSYS